MNRFLTSAAIAAALSVASPLASFAQMTGQSMPGAMGGDCPTIGLMGPGMGAGGKMGQGMKDPVQVGAMVDGRLDYLKKELNITDAQGEAWNGYSDAIKGRVETMQDMRKAMMDSAQKGSAVERMDARIENIESVLAALKAVKPATDQLYTSLNEDQKKAADQLIGVGCGAM